MKNFSFIKKGTLLKRGEGGRFHSASASWYAPVVYVVMSFQLSVMIFIYFLIFVLFYLFSCPWRFTSLFITYLQSFTLCYLAMNFCTRLWEFTLFFFQLAPQPLPRQVVILFITVLSHRALVGKTWSKSLRCGKIFIAIRFVDEEFSIV